MTDQARAPETDDGKAASRLEILLEEQETLIENVLVGILITADGLILRCNRQFLDTLGYVGVEGLLGKPASTFFASDNDYLKFSDAVRPMLASGGNIDIEWPLARSDGSLNWMHVAARPVRSLGHGYRTVWMMADISERRRAEESLREANEEMAAILESATIGIVFVHDRIYRRCNRRLEEIFGVPPGGLDNRSSRIFYPDEAAYRLGGDAYRDLDNGGIHRREQELCRADGSMFWCRLTGRLVDAAKPDSGSVWLFEDVDEEHAAAEALRASRQLLEGIVEHNSAAISFKTADGRFNIVNRRWEEAMGVSRQQAIGRTVFDLFPDAQALRFLSNDRRTMEARRVVRFEETIDTPAGPAVAISAKFPLFDGDGGLAGICTVSTDISDIKRLQAELETAKEAAEAAARSKSEFLANMSHEIRTPMNAITGLTHLALACQPEPRLRDYLLKIENATGTLLGIINDILDFSKIEAGKLELETEPFDLCEGVIDTVANIVAVKAGEKDIEVLFDQATDLPPILVGDALRLNQVLINLLGNAIKFTDAGQVVLRVRKEAPRIGERVDLRFDIQDTGIGMSESEMARLFQAFSQADGSITRRYGGTGLGLTISRRLVELMGGKIGVTSSPGQGSTFSFVVGFRVPPEALCPLETVGESGLAGRHVLVASGGETSRGLLRRYLEAWGCRVSEAVSGEEALARLRTAPADARHDLLLLDWRLPDGDAPEVVRRIREGAHQPAIRIVAVVSPFEYGAFEATAGEISFDAQLEKPFSRAALRNILSPIFNRPAEGKRDRGTVAAPAAIRGARILLAEDNEINRLVACDILVGARVLVTAVDNGRECVDTLAAAPDGAFDAVLLDVQMPVMDGYTATRLIRQNPRFREMPIIALTANAFASDRAEALAAGMDDHVAKPIQVAELFKTLERWLAVPRGRGARASSPGHAAAEAQGGALALPGFDVEDAMDRVGGDVDFYRMLLSNFVRDYGGDFVRDFEQECRAGDPMGPVRLAHTLKGVGATLGIPRVTEAARRLEQAQREGADVAEQLREVAGAIDEAVRVIERWAPPEKAG